MKHEEIIKLCKNHNWSELRGFLTSNIRDLSYKILVTALFQTYCPEEDLGLSQWDDKIRPDMVAGIDSLFNSAVDLGDMNKACALAISKNGLNDPKVAANIREYVEKNKNVLGQLLIKHPELPKDFLDEVKNFFGDMKVTTDDTFNLRKKHSDNSLFGRLMNHQDQFAASFTLSKKPKNNSESTNAEALPVSPSLKR